jgi:hypothetical protein
MNNQLAILADDKRRSFLVRVVVSASAAGLFMFSILFGLKVISDRIIEKNIRSKYSAVIEEAKVSLTNESKCEDLYKGKAIVSSMVGYSAPEQVRIASDEAGILGFSDAALSLKQLGLQLTSHLGFDTKGQALYGANFIVYVNSKMGQPTKSNLQPKLFAGVVAVDSKNSGRISSCHAYN